MKVKRAPESLTPVSKSSPMAAPRSTWSRAGKPSGAGLPPRPPAGLHLRTSTLPASSAPDGHAVVRQVGHQLQQAVQLGLDDFEPGGGGIEFRLERAHLGHHAIGALALGLELADLLAQAVALALQVFGAGLQRLALGLQRLEGRNVEVGLGISCVVQDARRRRRGLFAGRGCLASADFSGPCRPTRQAQARRDGSMFAPHRISTTFSSARGTPGAGLQRRQPQRRRWLHCQLHLFPQPLLRR